MVQADSFDECSQLTCVGDCGDNGKQYRKESTYSQTDYQAEGVEGTKVVTIEQASKEDLVVVPYDELVPTEGGSITFTIASNKAWEIIPSTAFLSNIDKTSGTGNEDAIAETVTVTLPANAGAKRAGTLTIKLSLKNTPLPLLKME